MRDDASNPVARHEPDIVARLRDTRESGYFVRKLLTEAADEIERLRLALRALQALRAVQCGRDEAPDMEADAHEGRNW